LNCLQAKNRNNHFLKNSKKGRSECPFLFLLPMTIHFILVEPAVPENVGAAARAIKTMGFGSLRLVNPCEYLSGKARWLAHASHSILDNAVVFDSLKAAVRGVDFVVATSAKFRSVKGDHHPAGRLPELIRMKRDSISSAAVVFGREESGLTNSEMQCCHISTFIPMVTSFPSLNLGQAVMLYAYILSGLHPGLLEMKKKPVQTAKFSAMLKQAEALLKSTKPGENQIIFNRITERLSLLGDNDINLLMSAMAALKEKISDSK
jgi:tRNA/rRNA methyltransferase